MSDHARRSDIPALLALLAGALAIGSSGIFVRLSETGPTATAFWRGASRAAAAGAVGAARAACGASAGRRRSGAGQLARSAVLLGRGVLRRRSRAVALLAAAHLDRRLDAGSELRAHARDAVGLGAVGRAAAARHSCWRSSLAFAGMLLILTPEARRRPARVARAMRWDSVPPVSTRGYILVVSRLRTRHGTGIVMFASTLVFSCCCCRWR